MSQYVGRTRLAYTRSWHLTDLRTDPRPLGRLASQIAITLMGKHKPIFDPSTDCGDYVVCTNCHDLHTTGKKMQKKKYYSHTTRPGSLKEITMEKMMAKWGGGEILRRAVRGMLPKNRLRDVRMGRLKCFEGEEHPYKQNLWRTGEGRSVGKVERAVREARAVCVEEAGKKELTGSGQ
ncbi:54S ribosomal protein L23, mitochondrial [Cercospora beticola]|uniref:Large ribosomal subunit protein uL13m n=1 Tax=Cercospora beticola TaxID=122368 RepID=A0A2G5HZR2_CERBT|nr:54S ribosomal protein L23, mitochondrial [Cercospora beticola]PIA98034.1 54S ribosomal protein L23, mitochondrial [Cercospora beticola]